MTVGVVVENQDGEALAAASCGSVKEAAELVADLSALTWERQVVGESVRIVVKKNGATVRQE